MEPEVFDEVTDDRRRVPVKLDRRLPPDDSD